MKNTLYTRSGFTLVEILFVLLVIVLIISFSLPAFRAVRYDIKNLQAQSALAKLAEARMSFYQNTKGWDIHPGISSAFTGEDAKNWVAGAEPVPCVDPALVGIPSTVISGTVNLKDYTNMASVSQLFACGYLDWHDFAGLPYTFHICHLYNLATDDEADLAPGCLDAAGFLASAVANSEDSAKKAGAKYVYKNKEEGYWMVFEKARRVVLTSDDTISKQTGGI